MKMKEEINLEDLELNDNLEIFSYKNKNIKGNKIDNPFISENNEKNKSNLKNINKIYLKSHAFPEGFNKNFHEIKKENNKITTYHYKEIAEIHEILQKFSIILDKDMIYYQKIPTSFLKEMKILHNEWFPVDYGYDYILKYLDGMGYFSLGAFTKIKGIEYLVGILIIMKN